MKIKIRDIASLIGGSIFGDDKLEIRRLSKIEEASDGGLTFLYLPAYEKYFTSTKASAIIVKPGFNKTRDNITYIECADPNKAFAKILIHYFTPDFPLAGIDSTAFIHPLAKIGCNVAIGKNVVISADCRIGDNTKIFHNSVLLEKVSIGSDSVIFQNVSIREECKLGNRVIIHAGAVIGSDGFGYVTDEKGVYNKIPQIGNVILEDDVEIGANVTIDRAALGSTILKRGVKIDNLVQIAHNVVVGEDTVMSAQTGISGSAKIGKHCIFAGQVGVVGHIEIGDNVIVIAQSGVSKSISKPGMYFGSPTKEFGHAKRIEAHLRNLPEYVEKIKMLEKEISILKEKIDSEK
ncbi:MAG: UDP-3-O-(3-hydroxymyristoyl)glucosamine N-acyltransferase [Ignavibacteriales bacterium]|nr:UDP-3-O-(3-hydroxymyristoyl)glucosamine N-acyltransferase [Ignavibacteriales bacterium]